MNSVLNGITQIKNIPIRNVQKEHTPRAALGVCYCFEAKVDNQWVCFVKNGLSVSWNNTGKISVPISIGDFMDIEAEHEDSMSSPERHGDDAYMDDPDILE